MSRKGADIDSFASIKAFVAVADEGGFAKAARKSAVATSSVMRQVDALEAQLGAILLNRSTRSVTPTPAGETYYAQAVRILSDLDEANRSVSELSGPPRGLLRVSLPVAFARLHVAPIVPEFLRACPGVELDLLMTDNVVNLVEDRIDLAIRIGNLESSSLIGGDLANGRLRPMLTDWRANVGRQASAAHQEGGVYAVYLADRRPSAKVRAFTEFLAEKFESPPYWDRNETPLRRTRGARSSG